MCMVMLNLEYIIFSTKHSLFYSLYMPFAKRHKNVAKSYGPVL